MADALDLPDQGRLPTNILYFARSLRRAGLRIGSGQVLDAIRAVEAAGFTERADFYWTLHACFVRRPEDRDTFHQVFRLFWRDPQFLEHMMAMLVPSVKGVQPERRPDSAERRAAEALLDGRGPEPPKIPEPEETEIEIDATATASSTERLRHLDFEQMSPAEIEAARRAIARLQLPVQPILGRRLTANPQGNRPDWRRTLRDSLRRGGEFAQPARRDRVKRWPNLVVLCDISGSMSQYSRMVLHFLHAVMNHKGAGWAQVYGFTFGTRLTNISRHLKQRDVDAALAGAGAEASDWEGGTRIGHALHVFNRDWSRRVLGQGAVVLLISDGLDRDPPEMLEAEMKRLHLSARRVIWLNPLLRWEGFLPRARGIRAMLPHVDCFRSAHSIASLEELTTAIASARDTGERDRLMQYLRTES